MGCKEPRKLFVIRCKMSLPPPVASIYKNIISFSVCVRLCTCTVHLRVTCVWEHVYALVSTQSNQIFPDEKVKSMTAELRFHVHQNK